MRPRRLTVDAPVCALVPHFGCEQWLDQALTSLEEQTRPPDAIVVIDDGSPRPPTDVVAAHPGVTLLAAADNGGPYRLVQTVIEATDFAAYLFQDADDWSAPERLEALLIEAEATGAELVGSHERRVRDDAGEVVSVAYPADVNAALRQRPGAYALLHPSSLVARDLVMRLGGYATGMRFSGDSEFLARAALAGTVRNAACEGYFRRRRAGSLTTAPDTGLRSGARNAVHAALAERARRLAADAAAGRPLDLRPWRTAPPARLAHVHGPALGARRARPAPPGAPRNHLAAGTPGPTGPPGPAGARHPDGRSAAPARRDPVFVIGAPASGQQALAAALGRHPRLEAVPDGRWLARVARDLSQRTDDAAMPVPARFAHVMGEALAALTSPGGRRRAVVGGASLAAAATVLAELLPAARFVHVVRDADAVVAHLLDAPVEGGAFYTAETAWQAWVEGVAASLALEADLGAERVLRVAYDELAADPAAATARCLDHLGEPPHPACVATLPPHPAARPALDPPASLRPAVHDLQRRLRGQAVAARPAAPTSPAQPTLLVDAVRALACESAPAGACVAVVSRGDPRLVDLPGRTGVHYPADPDDPRGGYAGYHPADSDAAVAALLASAATHLVVPATDLWWLDFYAGLRAHLDGDGVLVGYREGVGAVYRLGGAAVGSGTHAVRFVAAPLEAGAATLDAGAAPLEAGTATLDAGAARAVPADAGVRR